MNELQIVEDARRKEISLVRAWLLLIEALKAAQHSRDALPSIRRRDLKDGGQFWQRASRIIITDNLSSPLPTLSLWDPEVVDWLEARLRALEGFKPGEPGEGEPLYVPEDIRTHKRPPLPDESVG